MMAWMLHVHCARLNFTPCFLEGHVYRISARIRGRVYTWVTDWPMRCRHGASIMVLVCSFWLSWTRILKSTEVPRVVLTFFMLVRQGMKARGQTSLGLSQIVDDGMPVKCKSTCLRTREGGAEAVGKQKRGLTGRPALKWKVGKTRHRPS